MKELSENLKRLRESTVSSRPMSQTELAKKTGLEPSAISHYECGRRVPSLKNLIKLAKALNVSVNVLLRGL